MASGTHGGRDDARGQGVKVAGIIGGIAPESTISYYRQIVALWRERHPDGSYPRVLIDSIDMTAMLKKVADGALAELAAFLASEVEKLERAGADFALLASNTPHVVFEELRRRSPLPLVSIVEATRDAALKLRLSRLALFGTRFTMQGRFYPDVLGAAGITTLLPTSHEQTFIHEKYMGELVNGVYDDDTRQQIVAIIERMIREERIEGVILGGTELPLLLRDDSASGVRLLDTTRIHVERVVDMMLAA